MASTHESSSDEAATAVNVDSTPIALQVCSAKELALPPDDKGDLNVLMGHSRTGTWQFISAALLRNPRGEHQLIDDIESFVHVLGWTALCSLPSPVDMNCRTRVVSLLYDHSFKIITGHEAGGITKKNKFILGEYPLKNLFTFTEHSASLELVWTLASPFHARYSGPPTEEDMQAFESFNAFALEGQFDKKLLDTLPVYRYNLGVERLSNSE
ncbi:hypothetical protein EV401DRAFT_1891817 [Pisolithus croceorrhizus]|nr:hypothetical protein EV401DRAFT_1891817 [Pisolithus croceorrhizus]